MEETNTGTEADVEAKIYEIGFHIVPSVSLDKLGGEFSSLKDILEKNGAVAISEEPPKIRSLNYEMRKDVGGKYQKYTSAYFGWVKFEAGPEAVRIIDEAFKKHLSIIRHLLIKTARENTMTVPKIPFYRRAPTSGGAPKVEENKEVKPEGKPAVSEAELDKAIDAAIAE